MLAYTPKATVQAAIGGIPLATIVSALLIFVKDGAAKVADRAMLNSSYADIACGIVILFLVGCEFFIQYSIRFRHSKKGGTRA